MDAFLTTGIASSGSGSSGGGNWVKEATITVPSVNFNALNWNPESDWFELSTSYTTVNPNSTINTIAAKFPRGYKFETTSATVGHKKFTVSTITDYAKSYFVIGFALGYDSLSTGVKGANIFNYSSEIGLTGSGTVSKTITGSTSILESSNMSTSGAAPLGYWSSWKWYARLAVYIQHSGESRGNVYGMMDSYGRLTEYNPTIKNVNIDVYALY